VQNVEQRRNCNDTIYFPRGSSERVSEYGSAKETTKSSNTGYGLKKPAVENAYAKNAVVRSM